MMTCWCISRCCITSWPICLGSIQGALFHFPFRVDSLPLFSPLSISLRSWFKLCDNGFTDMCSSGWLDQIHLQEDWIRTVELLNPRDGRIFSPILYLAPDVADSSCAFLFALEKLPVRAGRCYRSFPLKIDELHNHSYILWFASYSLDPLISQHASCRETLALFS